MTQTFVAAGAVSTGNNPATLTPAMPAGLAAKDVAVCFATIRSVTATPSVAGWVTLGTQANIGVFAKVCAAGEPSPVVTFTGGAAGDDATAQVAAWRGSEPYAEGILFSAQTNVSAQNVAYPSLLVGADGHVVVVGGWKQDDSTGWAPIASYTEIGESNPTAGNDASMAWDYRIETAAANLAAGSFTVTGGAAAVSKGFNLLLRPAAAITVTEQDVYPPRLLVTVSGLTVGDDVSVYRVVAGVRTLLRAGSAADVTDPSFVVLDAELPFGIPVAYVAVVGGAEYATAATSYVLTGGKVAVSDAVGGTAAEVVILSWPERTRDGAASVFNVAGRNVVVGQGIGQATGAAELVAETTSAVDNLTAVLDAATSGIVQVRQPGGYDGVDAYVAVTGYAVRRWSQDGSDQRRVFALQIAEVDGWSPLLEARAFTYQDLADVYAGLTYATLNSDYGSYLALAQADLSS